MNEAADKDVENWLDARHEESLLWDQAHRQGVEMSLEFLVSLAAKQTQRSAQTAAHNAASEADKHAAEADRQLFDQLSHLLHVIVTTRRSPFSA